MCGWVRGRCWHLRHSGGEKAKKELAERSEASGSLCERSELPHLNRNDRKNVATTARAPFFHSVYIMIHHILMESNIECLVLATADQHRASNNNPPTRASTVES